MAILEQNEGVLVEKIEPPGLFKLATWIGKRMEVHCTGVGKALIAYLPEEEVDRLVKEHSLPCHNQKTVGSARKLKQQLLQIKNLRYSVDDEEDEIGLRCIGSPIFDHTLRPIAAISLAGTTAQITKQRVPVLAKKVKQTAARISREIGYGIQKTGS